MAKKKPQKYKPAALDPKTILPRIKTTGFLDAIQDVIKDAQASEDQMPYSEPFVADLIITYAFDMPESFQAVSIDNLNEMNLPFEDVFPLAMENFTNQLEELSVADMGLFRQIMTGGSHEACTLLFTNFWNQIASETEGQVIAAVPHRERLYCCSSESEHGLTMLNAMIEQSMNEPDNHNLSRALLVWSGEGWEERG